MKHESTPVHMLDIDTPSDCKDWNGGPWARLYWSQNAGMYGHQVVMEYNVGKGFERYTTSGCGYCKLSHALEIFYSRLFGKHGLGHGDLSYLCRGTKYHKGGNYYRMTLKQFEKLARK